MREAGIPERRQSQPDQKPQQGVLGGSNHPVYVPRLVSAVGATRSSNRRRWVGDRANSFVQMPGWSSSCWRSQRWCSGQLALDEQARCAPARVAVQWPAPRAPASAHGSPPPPLPQRPGQRPERVAAPAMKEERATTVRTASSWCLAATTVIPPSLLPPPPPSPSFIAAAGLSPPPPRSRHDTPAPIAC